MTLNARDVLLAESTELQEVLNLLPLDNGLERNSVAARLEDVQLQLSKMPPSAYKPARALLTFRGRPVIDNRGIFVDFGTRATNAFFDAVAKIAASISRPLASMGPLPKGDESQLLITSTAVGSFGFELEEFRPDQLNFGEASDSAQALELARRFLQSTLESDDDLADAAASTDPRAVDAVRTFLDILASNEAVCALEVDDKAFRFRDVGEVRRSIKRIALDNLNEQGTRLSGEFQGVLPKARTFEFKIAGTGEVVRGKVGPLVVDPDVINRHLHKLVTINVSETRVASGKPRYVLTAVPAEWPQ
jgi:hypothetical protein